jgi:hypothetical protein
MIFLIGLLTSFVFFATFAPGFYPCPCPCPCPCLLCPCPFLLCPCPCVPVFVFCLCHLEQTNAWWSRSRCCPWSLSHCLPGLLRPLFLQNKGTTSTATASDASTPQHTETLSPPRVPQAKGPDGTNGFGRGRGHIPFCFLCFFFWKN